jgi:hypothetical protein
MSHNISKLGSPPWKIAEAEWQVLSAALPAPPKNDKPSRGRPRHLNEKAVAEVCLFRHFHSLAPVYVSFGWNSVPEEFGVPPSTANRRYREWVRSGAWMQFWQALVRLRCADAKPDAPVRSPVIPILSELERAYSFFNARLFGGILPQRVAICLERPRRPGCLGYHACARWQSDGEVVDQISVTALALGQGAAYALEVLLHEMVHAWNHLVKLQDVRSRNQYHNEHFRDAAQMVGLECLGFDPQHGFAATRLSPQAAALVREFKPDESVFAWDVK